MRTTSSTAPLNNAWATIDGPILPSSATATPKATPTPASTSTNPTLPTPRTGSTWAVPNNNACRTTTATIGNLLRKPRITTPRKTISSTTGAAITAAITSETT